MTAVGVLALIAIMLLTAAAAVAGWFTWHHWRSEEQDTRLLHAIVHLRRRFHEGHVDERLPAKGRGFGRDVETAVNRLLDEAGTHLQARQDEAAVLAQALEVLGGVVTRTVEQLETTAREIEGLGVALGRAGGGGEVEALTGGDESVAGHCQTAAALAGRSHTAAARCRGVLEDLRATLATLAREAAGTTEGVQAVQAQWTDLRAGFDAIAEAAGTAEVLAVNASLAARRDADASTVLDRLSSEADEVAHGAGRALRQVRGLTIGYQDHLARLAPRDTATRLGHAAAGVAELDGALGRIQDLPPSLAALAGRLGSVLADAAAVLTAARREAERLVEKQVTA